MKMSEFFSQDSNITPRKDIIPQHIDLEIFKKDDNGRVKVSWLGHSAFLININGKIILLDPMLGQYAAPIALPSLKRYSSKLAFSIDDLDTIDAVIISHDHYDHLNFFTIKKIRNKVKRFFVPYGIGNHLKVWGVKEELIAELNWGQSEIFHAIEIICLPARHFSGRGPFNRNSTLWSSWAIKSQYGKIYFSGDSGYGSHFKKIGEEHGPFDLSLLDSGQYNKAWKHSHMFPEEAILAAQELRSEYYIPIHWGAFTLSMHPWTDPPERALHSARKMEQKIILPQIGQVFILNQNHKNISSWWKFYN
tara:strand:- start:21662 stop:22579 length:918 start_codon:yes stop_codon:yes gene_type:complete